MSTATGRAGVGRTRAWDVRAWPSLDRLLDAVDAITIVVPTSAHWAVAAAAIARGRHVFIEKPIAATVAEADALLEGRTRGRGCWSRRGTSSGSIARCVPRCRSSPIRGSSRATGWRRSPPRGADVAVVVLDLMIHDIDLVQTFVRQRVTAIAAVGVPLLTQGSVDIANARLEFAGGAVANITASRVSRERVRKLRIFQPSGYFSLDLAAGTGEHLPAA